MFAKLLKHDWRSVSKLLGILSLAALGVGIVGAILLRIEAGMIDGLAETVDGSSGTAMLFSLTVTLLGMVLGFLALALVVYGVGSYIILLNRFYKSRFTDQGYLMFTLPVNAHQIFLSGWINTLAWTAISYLTIGISVTLAVTVGFSGVGLEFSDFVEGAGAVYMFFNQPDIFWDMYYDSYAGMEALTVINTVVNFLTAPVIVLSCITLGATFAKRHKILMAIGIYYLYTVLSQTLTSIVTAFTSIGALEGGNEALIYTSAVLQILMSIGVAALGYFLSTYRMRNSLNLS